MRLVPLLHAVVAAVPQTCARSHNCLTSPARVIKGGPCEPGSGSCAPASLSLAPPCITRRPAPRHTRASRFRHLSTSQRPVEIRQGLRGTACNSARTWACHTGPFGRMDARARLSERAGCGLIARGWLCCRGCTLMCLGGEPCPGCSWRAQRGARPTTTNHTGVSGTVQAERAPN